MADNFCIQCGGRLTGGAKFCAQCGSPVGGEIEGIGAPPPKDPGFFERLGLKVRARGETKDSQQEQPIYNVSAYVLDGMLSMSLWDAPLSSEFLLAASTEEDWALLFPVCLLRKLSGVKVLCRLMTRYLIGAPLAPSYPQCSRQNVADEVANAVYPKNSDEFIYLWMFVEPVFKPQNYGEIDKAIRGKWVTVEWTFDGRKELEVETAVPLPMSGMTMKRRLQEHASWVERRLQREKEPESIRDAKEVLERIHAALKIIPDGFADHILCHAYMRQGDQKLGLVLSEEKEREEKAVAAGMSGFTGISRLAITRTELPEYRPAGIRSSRSAASSRSMRGGIPIERLR